MQNSMMKAEHFVSFLHRVFNHSRERLRPPRWRARTRVVRLQCGAIASLTGMSLSRIVSVTVSECDRLCDMSDNPGVSQRLLHPCIFANDMFQVFLLLLIMMWRSGSFQLQLSASQGVLMRTN